MPQFVYRAKDSALKDVAGTIEAETEAAAISRLGSLGVFPSVITEQEEVKTPGVLWADRRVSAQLLAYTTRQLADLLSGGLPLLGALTLLTTQTEHRSLRRVIRSLADDVRDGRTLSDALADHPRVFPPLYLSMVRTGEVGGVLDAALGSLADLLESEAELRSQVLSASVYPVFVVCFALAMTTGLIMFVVPALAQTFVETGQLLPLPTRIVLAVSGLLTRWWWAMLCGAAILVWVLRRWHATPLGRAATDRMLLGVPGIGTLARKLDTARATRNLGVLIGHGVPALQALDVVAQHISNTVLRRALHSVLEAVREGSSIAAAVEASKQFPLFVSNMVAVGEESGSVDRALLKVASVYEREIDRTMRALTSILEPVLLVLVGGIVMFIVLAMLLPIFELGLIVQ